MVKQSKMKRKSCYFSLIFLNNPLLNTIHMVMYGCQLPSKIIRAVLRDASTIARDVRLSPQATQLANRRKSDCPLYTENDGASLAYHGDA